MRDACERSDVFTFRTGSEAIVEALYESGPGRLSPERLLQWIRHWLVNGRYIVAPADGPPQMRNPLEVLLPLLSHAESRAVLLSGLMLCTW